MTTAARRGRSAAVKSARGHAVVARIVKHDLSGKAPPPRSQVDCPITEEVVELSSEVLRAMWVRVFYEYVIRIRRVEERPNHGMIRCVQACSAAENIRQNGMC